MRRRKFRIALGTVCMVSGLVGIALAGIDAVVGDRVFDGDDPGHNLAMLRNFLLGGTGLLAGVLLLVAADVK